MYEKIMNEGATRDWNCSLHQNICSDRPRENSRALFSFMEFKLKGSPNTEPALAQSDLNWRPAPRSAGRLYDFA
jgi:hypothetical protein